jgi:hypothetical protein
LQKAKASEPSARSLDEVMRELLDRRITIEDMDHEPIPLAALGRQIFSPGSSHAGPLRQDDE